MKLLRLKLFQESACYQKPFAFKVGETYPLPPFSTVKGMLHAVLNANEYIPMNLSIQGQSESMMIDYARKYMYKRATAQLPLSVAGLGYNLEPEHVTAMPMYVHLLYNIELVIHVEAETTILQQLYERLSCPAKTLSLGRWEDLVRIDEVAFVDAECSTGKIYATYDMYIPKSWSDSSVEFQSDFITKIYYRLPRKYEIRRDTRNWDYVSVLYVSKGQHFDSQVLFDGTYPIFLLEG